MLSQNTQILLDWISFEMCIVYVVERSSTELATFIFSGALSYSQGAARLMIPSTTISRARTESHSATHLNPHRGQGPQDPCTQPHKMYLSNLQKDLSTFLCSIFYPAARSKMPSGSVKGVNDLTLQR